MTGITIFSIPKPFEGHVGVIQRNAVRSWSRIPGVQVLLLGDDRGVDEAARRSGATHLPSVRRNEFGTPLLDDAFTLARQHAKGRWLCYVNADIVVSDDVTMLTSVQLPDRFLMAGRRWNLDVGEDLDLTDSAELTSLLDTALRHGELHPQSGSDYFLFPREMDWGLPSFAVGRPGWDNWLIFRARQLGVPLIDSTPVITVIHQNHDYAHVPAASGHAWEGPEADRNRDLGGGYGRMFTMEEATHVLTPVGLRRRSQSLKSRARVMRQLSPWARPAFRLYDKLRGRP